MDKDSNMARAGFPSARISNLTTELLQGNYPTISTLGHTKKINTNACQEQFWTCREKAKRKQKEEAKKKQKLRVFIIIGILFPHIPLFPLSFHALLIGPRAIVVFSYYI
jgi:hypothetical protein